MSVYKIFNDSKVYIGSTKKKYVSSRISQHRWDYKRNRITCNSKYIFDEGDWGWEIIEKDIPVENLKERERYHIQNTENCINHNLPGQSKKEYQKTQRYKDLIKKASAKYYEKNKEQIRERQRERQREYRAKKKDSK